MQPSELEIQREVETLRDIRRRSTAQGGPGSLILDPDLPNATQPTSSTAYWPTDDSSSSSHEDDSDNGSIMSAEDPSSLFWVPARLHPEIAPAEFRAFLKEHARAPADGSGTVSRSSSVSSSALGRKKSMLSRQYKPSANDGIEDETVMPRRNRTSVFANPAPQLTISDLQKLEELAEEASKSDDPSKLRSVLRRSLSLNVAPSVIDQMDDMPDMGDDVDSPIIVPRPGQILRRAARTKIRKPGTGEGPHRFTSKRARGGEGARAATLESAPRTSTDRSSSDHGDIDSGTPDVPQAQSRPESYSEETSIYDSYARDSSEEPEPPVLVSTPEHTTEFAPVLPPPLSLPPIQLPQTESLLEPEYTSPTASTPPVLHHPQPQRLLSPPVAEGAPPLRTPSPEITSPTPSAKTSPPSRPSLHEAQPYSPPSPSPSDHHHHHHNRREKDKKGLFGKWSSDKGGKRGSKEKEKDHREREKEKEGNFFGSLFGMKKKQDEAPPLPIGTSGREAAVALLGQSKSSKSYVPSPSPQPVGGYARYPIHVERAIYRLSHIKLANPRRPLYEQVLISNLMFWYLGVINKAQNPTTPPAGTQSPPPTTANGTVDSAEREKKEREERERVEKEHAEKEQRERSEQKKESRRGSLTKNPSPGTPGARRAETPVRGPQYDMQHRAMEQEYGYSQGGTPPMGRTASAPPTPSGYQPNRAPAGQTSQYQSSVQLVQPQPQVAQNRYYNGMGSPPLQSQYTLTTGSLQLPPGAMPPVNVEQGGWMSPSTPGSSGSSSVPPMSRSHTSPSPPPRVVSPPSSSSLPSSPSPRRARSPPPPQQQSIRYTPAQEKQPYISGSGGGRLPGRSLSATAATPPVPPVPQINGKMRKGQSAHAVLPHQRVTSEEEDVPLAIYQQQRRK